MSRSRPLLQDNYDEIADALVGPGFIILDGVFPPEITDGLVDLIAAREGLLTRAGIGREGDYQVNDSVRGDAIQWLEPGDGAVTEFLSAMDKLRRALNERLFLGLADYEAHFASYAPGAFYKKHRDAFRGQPGRKVSSVFYLNPAWDLAAGGELVLYDEAGEQELVRVAPECGRLVLFLSEDFPHEVLPARNPRQSIAGWFRISP
ncbi:2OG-Fe(II) oxygenase [Cellvibrio sp. KY-GH-1]|uniref:2OG-Fe(II) oxygenase n=1 Tax=Cellvibrio sp. KY-GH-1 TaxID=2303332 RepID=UPI001244D77D|nr:2OG-Fe(II) oxygenase [Cellvibrio sp. KY-GH-1]QEY18476.1 2OG-Fe(II) oxygenase [Cellvibrio sp. KY-GH-1]